MSGTVRGPWVSNPMGLENGTMHLRIHGTSLALLFPKLNREAVQRESELSQGRMVEMVEGWGP